MKTKPIPVVLVVFLAGALPVWSQLHQDRLPEFAAYLKAAGLTTLYNAEIRTLCFEHSDRAACLELARIRAGSAKQAQTTALLDSITYRDRREEIGSALLRASVLAEIGEYKEALETIEPAVDAMPAKDLLLEAILIKARCLYHLGQTDEALVNLRSIRPLVPEGRVPDLPLFLGLCEEADGNLGDAERFLEEAEAGGQPDAALALLRLALKRGDLDHFRVVADEIGAGGKEIPYQHLCDLAGEVGEILPVAWRSLMEPVIADSEFAVEMCPGVVGSLVRLAEAGEDVSGYCRTLLARPISSRSAHWLRYARAISVEDSARCDTLALLARTASVRDLRIRCIAGCLEYAGDDERTAFAGRLLPLLQGLWGDLDPSEQEEAAALVIEAGQAGPGRQRLLRLAEDLQVGYDDAALLEVAAVIEASGAVDEALAIYESLSQSPVPSEYSLRAMRSAYLLRRTGKPEEDVAGVVERVAKEGVSPFDLGDLFMDRLKDFDRAASFYRRALADPPEGVSADRVKIKLAEALAVEALEAGEGGLRSEAIRLIAGLADTNTVDAGDILRVLEVSTAWLSESRDRAFAILQSVSRREDLGSRDLYQSARLLYDLFSGRDGNVYAQCAMTLRRLADRYPNSREAPLGAYLAARLKFTAGDYVGALEAFKACREVWRNHAVTRLCEEGIGDCYLYSGGFGQALEHYGNVNASPRVVFKIGQCHELSDRPDSALRYYDLALRRISPLSVSGMMRLRRALVALEEMPVDAALARLDSALPRARETFKPYRDVAAAYALGRKGYREVASEMLERASRTDGDIACEALLLLSKLESDEESGKMSGRLGAGETVCKSICGAIRLLRERAYLACSSGPLDECLEQRKRYQQRFPLDMDARLSFDVQQALLLYREGLEDSASAVIDGLTGSGRKHDTLAYGLYRKGIHHMVEGDYRAALRAFLDVEQGYPDSDIYYDTALKLGTVYYMLEAYDSSTVYFEKATRADKATITENAYFNLGLALEEAGRLTEASEAFRTLAVRFPFSERFDRALMRAAYTLQQAGRPEDAIAVYRDLLQYAEAPETAAEAMYWIGESFAEMGDPVRAACEFLRLVYLLPDGGPWTGTAAFRAGMECEKAGLTGHALIVYRENVRRFGKGTEWGRASAERLDELLVPMPARQETEPDDAGE